MDKLEKYESKDEFLVKRSPNRLFKLANYESNYQLLKNDKTEKLATIKKQYGYNFIQGYISLWIQDINKFLNLTEKMNEEQIYQTADLIYQKYYYFSILEIASIFKRAKLGEFNPKGIFRIDGMVILAWFDSYDKERINSVERLSLDKHYIKKEKEPETRQSSKTLREVIKISKAKKDEQNRPK